MAQPDENNDAEAAFGQAVRGARNTLGWTLDHLRGRLLDGYGIDLSKTAMARLEQGNRPIRLNEVHALAHLLGIDLSGFGRGTARPNDSGDPVDRALKIAAERRDAVARELEVVGDHMAMLGAAVADAMQRRDQLRTKMAELDTVMARLANGQHQMEWARAVLEDLLGEEREAAHGDR